MELSRFAITEPWLQRSEPAVLVSVSEAQGSTPRDAGTQMAVSATAISGTIGGGQLEWLATARAREILSGAIEPGPFEVALGPGIGQCCGGRVTLDFTVLNAELAASLKDEADREERSKPQVLVFGAGHTGKALALALSHLPLRTRLIDSRPEAFTGWRSPVETVNAAVPESLVADSEPGAAYVTMTHEHSLDFLITAAALGRGDAAYCGMIGSATKRAVFANWLKDNDYPAALIDRLTCPIGGSALRDKRPEVIAALTAAEIAVAVLGAHTEAMR